jgi:hypothetical protein
MNRHRESIRLERTKERHQDRERIKLSMVTNDITVYVQNPQITKTPGINKGL